MATKMNKHKIGIPCPNKIRVEVNHTDLGITSVGSVFCKRCRYHNKIIDYKVVLCCYDKTFNDESKIIERL